MRTPIHDKVEQSRAGANPKLIARLPSGWAVLGDHQQLRGYSLILPDPVVPTLNDLTVEKRMEFLRDMSLLGDAVLKVTEAVRCNYEILCNLDPALHAHVFPRFNDEPEAHRTKPVWFYDFAKAPPFDLVRDRATMSAIARELEGVCRAAGVRCETAL